MTTSSVKEIAALQKAALEQASLDVETAEVFRREGQAIVLLGLFVSSCGRRRSDFHSDQIAAYTHPVEQRNPEVFESIRQWFKHDPQRKLVASNDTFFRNSGVLGTQVDKHQHAWRQQQLVARAIEAKWQDRITEVTQELRNHPVMKGLPPVELKFKGKGDEFKFTLQFRVR